MIGGNYFFNGSMKGYMTWMNCEHWQVGPEDRLCDQFHKLTQWFEMDEEWFFVNMVKQCSLLKECNYVEQWMELSRSLDIPEPEYGKFYAIRQLISHLPENSDLQLANGMVVRYAHLLKINNSIRVNCNRGVNGIDGSMSTAVGFAVSSNAPLFYITGDLSFFYDMNALWNKHLSSKIRIMLINNDGGAVLYHGQEKEDGTFPVYCAAGHHTNAQGWAESRGIKYISARTKEEVDCGVEVLVASNINYPILLEVFTEMVPDYTNYNNIQSSLHPANISGNLSLAKKMKRKIKDVIGEDKINAIKVLLE